MSKRTLILTGYTDMLKELNYPYDKSSEEMADLCLPSKQRYAKKHGYDLMSLRSFGIDKKYGFKETDIGYLRALRAFEMLEYYDVVMWIDADSIITNPEIKIEDFLINDNRVFRASYDWMHLGTFSTGNFILQNTPTTEDFFQIYLTICPHTTTEQMALNMMMGTQMKDHIRVMEHRYLNGAPEDLMRMPEWETRQKVIFPWDKTYFLAHLTGLSNTSRINILTTTLKEYL